MTHIPFVFPGLPHVRAAFTTRLDGVSRAPFGEANLSWEVGDDEAAVRENRLGLQRELGFTAWTEARQVHGNDVLIEPPPGTVTQQPDIQADGLATSRPGLALVVKTADCQPILLAHGGGRHVAALHCGWRANRREFPRRGVVAFCNAYNLDPKDLYAVRGPSLGPAASEFIHFDREWGGAFQSYFDPGTRAMDLWRLTREQLVRAGLRPERIYSLDLCTYSLSKLFFSYRRDKITGRQAGLIWIADQSFDGSSAAAISR